MGTADEIDLGQPGCAENIERLCHDYRVALRPEGRIAQGVDVLICHVPLHLGRIDLAQSETSSSLRCCIEYDLVDEAVSSSRLTVYEEEKWGLSRTGFVGYRAVHDNYSHDGFVNKLTQQGPMLGFTYQFSVAQ